MKNVQMCKLHSIFFREVKKMSFFNSIYKCILYIIYWLLIYYIIYYYLLPTSSPLTLKNKKRTQFAHLHIAGKDTAAHHRNVP